MLNICTLYMGHSKKKKRQKNTKLTKEPFLIYLTFADRQQLAGSCTSKVQGHQAQTHLTAHHSYLPQFQ